ncbi:peptidoglycan-binding protein [Desulfofundulus thermocisternus]|uniref:peptidoglycan-binding protein n=1 Tax=Desulfofundulus thermocisternus TaxID=42471 RepID=UPI00217E94F9|nr:peptidoglycan-binding protein [Desulfofundulus thermocisternus]MCS5696175.1 peptidoglycan-binding protein [Desulfofundulus thermocisternus]
MRRIIYLFILFPLTLYTFLSWQPAHVLASGRIHKCDTDEQPHLTAPSHRGQDIVNLQQCLSSLGYFQGSPSGLYDETTLKAVERFQKEHGLLATGVADVATWQTISQAMLAKPNQGVSPSPGHELFILVDTRSLTMTVFSRGQPIRQYPVALGKPGSETPPGLWKVVDKSDEYFPGMGPRWMGLNIPTGTYGIHGTDSPWSIGTFASAGCVRMHNAHVVELYDWVSEGTPVLILGNPFLHRYPGLYQGSCGTAVQELQRTLRRLGYYDLKPDGIFGPRTAEAVIKFRKRHGLEEKPVVDDKMWRLLGF